MTELLAGYLILFLSIALVLAAKHFTFLLIRAPRKMKASSKPSWDLTGIPFPHWLRQIRQGKDPRRVYQLDRR